MPLLLYLAELRTPFWDKVMLAVSHLGTETALLFVAMVVMWCIDKRWGWRMCALCLAGLIINLSLKDLCMVPRPWTRDAALTVVEAARETAVGYSFPSGHTQIAVVLYGGLAVWMKRAWAWCGAVVLSLLTAFSRMYLGVHTFTDVAISLFIGGVCVAVFAWLTTYSDKHSDKQIQAKVWWILFVACLLLLLQVHLTKSPNSLAAHEQDALDTAWILMVVVVGSMLSWYLDVKLLHFPIEAAWWIQILKCVFGIAILLVMRYGLRIPLLVTLGDGAIADGIRYLQMVFMAAGVWPATFPFWAALDKKHRTDIHRMTGL